MIFAVSADGVRVGHLERREDAGGIRDYLAEQPLSCGAGLDLLMPDGAWLPGRYEMAWSGDKPTAMFYRIILGFASFLTAIILYRFECVFINV